MTVVIGGVSVVGAGCALLITWFTALTCAAQHASPATAQGELTHFGLAANEPSPSSAEPSVAPSSEPSVPSTDAPSSTDAEAPSNTSKDALPVPGTVVSPELSVTGLHVDSEAVVRRQRAWMFALAGTGAAFATGFVLTDRLSARLTVRELERSKDVGLDPESRARARSPVSPAEQRADLLQKVSDICLAGSVAATGAALLIWLTGRRARADRQTPKTLLGPMVLRAAGGSGGGLVLREKF